MELPVRHFVSNVVLTHTENLILKLAVRLNALLQNINSCKVWSSRNNVKMSKCIQPVFDERGSLSIIIL